MRIESLRGRIPLLGGFQPVEITFDSKIIGIEEIADSPNLPIISMGLIDTHTHGNSGVAVSARMEDLGAISMAASKGGVTRSILSLVSSSIEDEIACLESASQLEAGIGVIGIHLEGPFISHSRRGAHNPSHIRDPDEKELKKVTSYSSLVSITIDPAKFSSKQISELSKVCVVAIGHTEANYEESLRAFDSGATVLTHALNAMPQLNSREPGPLGAALESGAFVEIIADGEHLSPVVAKAIAAAAGEKLILVTDSMAAAGASDGSYSLGGVEIVVEHGVARKLDDGALAGSTLSLDLAIRNLISWGYSPHLALRAASVNPAKAYGLSNYDFVLGGEADFVVWDSGFIAQSVYRRGFLLKP